jgi:lipoate-protein ligase B
MAMLVYKELGQLDYVSAVEIQNTLLELRQRGSSPDILLFVEHPHVYTLGRGGKESNIVEVRDVPVYRTGRGGDVTYHGPGQVVVYPLIDLRSKLRKDVHRYVKNLERTAIRTLKDFALEAARRPPYTGVWIADRKIAAIGVAVRRSITLHGLALNVNTDLSYFKRIIPCGLAWADVTSMAKELGKEQSLNSVKNSFLRHFVEVFRYSDVEEAEDRESRMEDRDPRSSIIHPRPA